MLDKKTIFILLGTLLFVGALVVWGMQEETPTDDPNALVYYYGEGCPHCKTVQEFLDKNDIPAKVSFEKKEVWSNTRNSAEMARRAKACGIQPTGMGVPFVYADGQCYMGAPDVIEFFSQKTGITTESGAQSETGGQEETKQETEETQN